jgi:hypothetical protein
MFRWPDDFLSLDDGALQVRRDLRTAFQRAEWTDVRAVLDSPVIHYNRLRSFSGGWDTGLARLTLPEAGREIAVHVKRFRSGFRAAAAALREAEAAGLLQAAGVPCMDVAAVGRLRGSAGGGTYSAFFMSEQVGTGESAFARVQRLRQAGSNTEPAELRGLFENIAETTARMHAAGIYHGDCKWKHFLLDRDADGREFVRLIDLERVRRRRGPGGVYDWIKDLSQIERSMRLLGAGDAEQEAWHACYARCYREGGGPFSALAGIGAKAARARWTFVRLRRPLVRALNLRGERAVRVETPADAEGAHKRARRSA